MAKEQLTWQQKVEKGLPLNWLEQVKRDAHEATTRRLEDEARLRARQAAQEAGQPVAPRPAPVAESVAEASVEAPVAEEVTAAEPVAEAAE